MKTKIAIFASGQGSNARRLMEYFRNHSKIEIDCLICNRKQAGAIKEAQIAEVKAFYFPKDEFLQGDKPLKLLQERGVDWIVLAGFLLKIPQRIIGAYQGRMVNVHPALLPKFGGAGMYGDRVHEAVLESGEQRSGISIHWVDEGYDTGSVIAQFDCAVESSDDLQSLKRKIQALEHKHLPRVVESLIIEKQAV